MKQKVLLSSGDTLHMNRGFGDADCSSRVVAEGCQQLLNSVASFQPYPHKRQIRLAVSPQLRQPLNLTLQRGTCNISCEGGSRNHCPTFVQNFYWQNVSSPYFFTNCTPNYHYCITATVGNCCPVCTETVFMQEFQNEVQSAEGFAWNFAAAALVLLAISTGFGALIIKNYVKGCKTSSQWSSEEPVHAPLRDLELQSRTVQVTVLCLYVRDQTQKFLDCITSLQTFLKRRGLNVIDIYNEEEEINESVHIWIQNVLQDQNTKIILIDTDLIRLLWNYDPARCNRVLRPVEQAILYTHSCIPLINLHSRLFVVSLQAREIGIEGLIDLGNGRLYVFPVNRERLVQDLMTVHVLP